MIKNRLYKKKKWNLLFAIAIISAIVSGCNIKMSAEERVNLFAKGSKTTFDSVAEIKNPENNQFPRLTVEWKPYQLEELETSFLTMMSEDMKKKEDDYVIWIQNSNSENSDNLNEAGMLSVSSDGNAFRFYLSAYDQYYLTMVESISDQQKKYTNSNIKTGFPADKLDDFSEKEAEETSNKVLKQIGFSEGTIKTYAMDLENLNKIQMREHRPESPWKKGQQAYLLVYQPEYRGIPIENIEQESMLKVFCSKERGIFMATADMPVLTDIVKKEEIVTVITGEEALKLAQPLLGKVEPTAKKVTDVSLVYTAPSRGRDGIGHTIMLEPTWRITYTQTIHEQEVSDIILLDGVTGKVKDNVVHY